MEATSDAVPCHPATYDSIPGLVETADQFINNVNADIPLSKKLLAPKKAVHMIYIECVQLYNSTNGSKNKKKRAALKHFDDNAPRLDIDHSSTRAWFRINLDRLFVVPATSDSCDHPCLHLLCNDNFLLIRNWDAATDNSSQDTSKDVYIPYLEHIPDIFNHFLRSLDDGTVNNFSEALAAKMLSKSKHLFIHRPDGLLTKVRQAITSKGNIYITDPIMHCMLNKGVFGSIIEVETVDDDNDSDEEALLSSRASKYFLDNSLCLLYKFLTIIQIESCLWHRPLFDFDYSCCKT